MNLIKPLRSEKNQDTLILIIGALLALLLRIALIEYESGDFVGFVSVWLDYIREHGGLLSLKQPFSQYTPSTNTCW